MRQTGLWHRDTSEPPESGAISEPLLLGTLTWLRWLLLVAILALSLIGPTVGRFGFTATELVLVFAAYSAVFAAYSAVFAAVQRRTGWLAVSLWVLAVDAAVILGLIGLCGSVRCPLYFLSPLVVVPLLLSLVTPVALAATAGLGAAVSLLTISQPDWDGSPAAVQLVVFENILLLAFAAPVAELARGAIGGDLGLVALLQDGGSLEAVWTAPPADPHLAQRGELRALATVGLEGKAVVLRDTRAGPGYGLYETLGIRSCIAVPLQAGDETVGVRLVGSRQPGAYQEGTLSWLDAIARPAAFSIGNARRYDRQCADAARMAALEHTKSDFLFAASHELRTPLAAIKIAAGLLREHPARDPEARDKLLASVGRNTERLEKLVDEILDMARLQTGALRLDWVLLDPSRSGAVRYEVSASCIS